MDRHHAADQSYRIPRRARADRTSERALALMAFGRIKPPTLVRAPSVLLGQDAPIEAPLLVRGCSQTAAMAGEGLVSVLVFGSSTKPGGGWRNGACAQEEDLSLASTWGVQAEAAPEGFYKDRKGLGGLGPDAVLVAHGGWLADPHGVPLFPFRPVLFTGVAAPNLGHPATGGLSKAVLIDHLARRLAGALLATAQAGATQAVMGAIGCGVFQWRPEDSAIALRRAVNHVHACTEGAPQIVLALPDPKMEAAFLQALTAPAAPERRPTPHHG